MGLLIDLLLRRKGIYSCRGSMNCLSLNESINQQMN